MCSLYSTHPSSIIFESATFTRYPKVFAAWRKYVEEQTIMSSQSTESVRAISEHPELVEIQRAVTAIQAKEDEKSAKIGRAITMLNKMRVEQGPSSNKTSTTSRSEKESRTILRVMMPLRGTNRDEVRFKGYFCRNECLHLVE